MPDRPLAQLVDGRVVVHDETRAVRWDLPDLVAADGHVVRVGFGTRVRALDDATEKRMLAETLLSRAATVTPDDVRRHFHDPLRTAVARIASEHPAEHLLDTSSVPALEAALVQAARAVAFTSGIDVLPPFQTTIDSPTLAHQRLEILQQSQARRRAQHRRELEAAVASGGGPALPLDLPPDSYVEQMTAAIDLAAARAPRATLVAASGQRLVLVEVADGVVAAPRLVPLPDDLGPLRAVRCAGDGELLIGTQRGVLRVRPDAADAAERFRDPGLDSTLGFNAVVATDEWLHATHADAGVVTWHRRQPAEPTRVMRTTELQAQLGITTGTPRHPCPLDDGRIAFAFGGALCTIDLSGDVASHGTGADVGAITLHHGRVHVVRCDGSVERRDARTLDPLDRNPPLAALTAAGVLPCLDWRLLLAATPDGTIAAVGDRGQVVRRFTSTHREPRAVTATPRYLAALAADRNRVVLWQTPSASPLTTLHLAPLTRHRIADLCWVEA